MKPPAWRRERALYPVFAKVQTSYHDVDAWDTSTIFTRPLTFDEARFRFSQAVLNRIGVQVRLVTADARVNYLAEGFYPGEVEISTGILGLGSSAYEIGQAMFQKGACVALCAATFVHPPGGAAQPLPAATRTVLQEFLVRAPDDDGA